MAPEKKERPSEYLRGLLLLGALLENDAALDEGLKRALEVDVLQACAALHVLHADFLRLVEQQQHSHLVRGRLQKEIR